MTSLSSNDNNITITTSVVEDDNTSYNKKINTHAYPTSPDKQQEQLDTSTDTTATAGVTAGVTADVDNIPNEFELVLLCLDYLRNLRRGGFNGTTQEHEESLRKSEMIDPSWLSLAIYALSRCFIHTNLNLPNDPYHSTYYDVQESSSSNVGVGKENIEISEEGDDRSNISLPSLHTINKEICISANFDDGHKSNAHRFYHLNGLACGVSAGGPISLTEATVAGITAIGGRSRYEAEQEMISSPLFEQFVNAVQAKGFFKISDSSNNKESSANTSQSSSSSSSNNDGVYEERFRKVVAKFRQKLAIKAEAAVDGYWMGSDPTLNDWTRFRIKMKDCEGDTPKDVPLASERVLRSLSNKLREKQANANANANTTTTTTTAPSTPQQSPSRAKPRSTGSSRGPIHTLQQHHEIDLEEAERFKNSGNVHMQNREFDAAVEAYTTALRICPAGPTSHVYFCNRAAALLSLKKYPEAVLDSERSLALKPEYGKAHARLGLAHYVQGEYKSAVESYTDALKYEPDNKTSKSYLEKAQYRLAALNKKKISSGSSIASDRRREFSGRSSHLRSPSPAFAFEEIQINTIPDTVNTSLDSTASATKPHPQSSASSAPNSPIVQKHNSTTQTEIKQRQLKEKEADKLKNEGNTYMSQKQYSKAVECYTSALRLSPAGINSHVYFSNRAAALCYLEKYIEAERDSEKSLVLKPEYGKAHARLGLSRFFLGDYHGAVDAYNNALHYDPGNKASESYLAKAKVKLDEFQQLSHYQEGGDGLVEYDNNQRKGGGRSSSVGPAASASRRREDEGDDVVYSTRTKQRGGSSGMRRNLSFNSIGKGS